MKSETIKLSGRDLHWYAANNQASASKPTGKKGRPWKRHLAVVVALISLKLMVIAGSDGIEMLTFWLNDTRGLLGWP